MISIVIPASNEEKSIKDTLSGLKGVLLEHKVPHEIILVDDGSDDKTVENAIEIPDVRVIHHPERRGYGAALKRGILNAIGDWILIIDADASYPANEVPKILKHIGDYDMVVGSRVGENVSIEYYRRPAKWFITKLANYLSGQKIPDLNSGLRAFNRKIAVEFFSILPNGFSFTTTLTLALLCNGYSVKYIPINYHPRIGISKIEPLKDGFNFVLLVVKSVLYFNPLRVFIPVSIFMFLFGLWLFLYSWLVLGRVMDMSVIIITTVAVQTMLLGLLADLIVKTKTKFE